MNANRWSQAATPALVPVRRLITVPAARSRPVVEYGSLGRRSVQAVAAGPRVARFRRLSRGAGQRTEAPRDVQGR